MAAMTCQHDVDDTLCPRCGLCFYCVPACTPDLASENEGL